MLDPKRSSLQRCGRGWARTCGIGVFLALAGPGTPVLAQCSSSNNPTPAGSQTVNKTGALGSFGLASSGTNGCDGADGRIDKSGQAGFPGQGSGDATLGVTAATVTANGPPGLFAFGIGGNGGTGGKGGKDVFANLHGGDGGLGGNGGNATLSFSGTISGADYSITANADGGSGGLAGDARAGVGGSNGGHGGAGGDAGNVRVTTAGSVSSNKQAVVGDALGGRGGNGGVAPFTAKAIGGDGGAGGAAGAVSIEAGGIVTAMSDTVLTARTNGGNGGAGGTAAAFADAVGGSGGSGGAGGSSSINVLNGAEIFAFDEAYGGNSGLLVQSNGGIGGAGGKAGAIRGKAGGGGFGGAGGEASATISGLVSTKGQYAHGVLVQSVGGGGGEANNATGIFTKGGAGLTGGDGGDAGISSTGGLVETAGDGAVAVLVQSVGGGGGSGGNALSITGGPVSAGVAIGGNGGLGGTGGSAAAYLYSGTFASLSETGGGGILAQSIGGAGGSGGNSTTDGAGILNLAIGGDGNQGASAGDTVVSNAGLVTTRGDHAAGIEAQSIGGGGGKGGSASTFGVNIVPINVSVGGRGGSGGPAGQAQVTNSFQVVTFGPDAHGIKAQSIGGGGGHGGSAVATSIALAPDDEIPAISVSVGIGGKGGSGNTGNTVSLTNGGFVATAGHGSGALLGQSVGGGGGTGGDSTAASYSAGSDTDISIDVSIGGSGGTGGTGGAVTVANSGLLVTGGQDSHAAFGQSVGGGGGIGGGGDASSTATGGDTLSMAVSVAVGGTGGTGGHGGKVSLGNSSGIVTSGDGADGMFGQSVGGGGGTGGGGVGKSNGDNLSVSVAVGGSGGAGGNGGEVDITNTGGVHTIGTDAIGMTVQSVGGGGGRGGKGGATAGGAPDDPASALVETIANGLNIGQSTKKIINHVFQVGDGVLSDIRNIFDLQKIAGDEQEGGDGEDGDSPKVTIGVAVGGRDGAAGVGSAVTATNSGAINTAGALADGILAQSIGGGGGIGGAATSTTSDGDTASASLGLGGKGNAGGSGGVVTVNSETGSSVTTTGVSAMGVVAQSIGGGGGRASMAGAKSGVLKSASLSIGGSGGASGDGGTVLITHRGAQVVTSGKHAVGVFAQSVGGGGGLARVISTDQTGNQNNNPDTFNPDGFALTLGLGGAGTGGGGGGAVDVLIGSSAQAGMPAVQTSGRNAHGVLAQSIGGGGGTVVGGTLTGTEFFIEGNSGISGDGGTVSVTAMGQGGIATTGDGAIGILAQSIGGGGGLAGDTAGSLTPLAFSRATLSKGDGDLVLIKVEQTTIRTAGRNAPAIFAQSVGGGGGHVATNGGVVTGTAGGTGNGGDVVLNVLDGSIVEAGGPGSAGIQAQSAGQSAGKIAITIDDTSRVTGGDGAYAIALEYGLDNTITNAGMISSVDGATGRAIIANTQASNTIVTNTGTIQGSISSVTVVNNAATGLLEPGSEIQLGSSGKLVNAGTISVGGRGHLSQTRLTGDLQTLTTGTLLVDIDVDNNQADLLEVEGHASLDGTIEVNPVSLGKSKVTVLSARDGIDASSMANPSPSHLFTYTSLLGATPGSKQQSLTIRTDADFTTDQKNLDNTQRDMTRHLQKIWESEATGFGTGFAALASVGGPQDYAQTLEDLSGREIGAIASARFDASQRFSRAGFSCPTFVGTTSALTENDCAWGRVVGTEIDQDSTGSQAGYDWTGTTLMVGGQRALQSGWFLGGALGYETSRLSGDGDTTDVDGQAVLASATLKRWYGQWLFAGAIDLGYGWYDSTRSFMVGGAQETASASPNTYNAGLHFRVARQVPFDQWYLQPKLDVGATWMRLDGYTEKGAAPYNLEVDSSDGWIFAASPALRAGRRVDLAGGAVLDVFVSAGASFFNGNDWQTQARFADAPSGTGGFTSKIDSPSTVGTLSAGVDVATIGRLDFRLQVETSFAEDYRTTSGLFRLNYLF